MEVLMVYAHHQPKSFNAALLDRALEAMIDLGRRDGGFRQRATAVLGRGGSELLESAETQALVARFLEAKANP